MQSASTDVLESDYRSTDLRKKVQIFRSFGDDEPLNIPELFSKIVDGHGDRMALMVKNQQTQQWQGITYKEYKSKVEKIAKVFIKLGLERHGAVAVLASNCLEWFISDLAAIHAG